MNIPKISLYKDLSEYFQFAFAVMEDLITINLYIKNYCKYAKCSNK